MRYSTSSGFLCPDTVDRIWLISELTLLLWAPQGKKGRPGEDGSPGPKGQEVKVILN